MPGLDGTGPRGLGSMTGGARGLCNPYRTPGTQLAGRRVTPRQRVPAYTGRPAPHSRGRSRRGLGRGFQRVRSRGRDRRRE